MQDAKSSTCESQHEVYSQSKIKRPREEGEVSGRPVKLRRLSKQRSKSPLRLEGSCRSSQDQVADRLLSPSLTRSGRGPFPPPTSPSNDPVARKRKAKSTDCLPTKQSWSLGAAQARTKLEWWLLNLPDVENLEDLRIPEIVKSMRQSGSKRSLSSDSSVQTLPQSGDGSDTSLSRDKKYSVYKDVNYPVVLETKGSYMRPSKTGMVKKDRELCEKLLTTSQPASDDTLFDDKHFGEFQLNLHGRSEARIYADLNPRLVPSVENLYICGREEFAGLVEGHNDPWIKSVPFYGPRPQPDRTFGFKWSNFTEPQRRKLMIKPTEKSYYTAREDIYFPFLTVEVKCGKQGLDFADIPNVHSMTVALRGVVDIYRKAKRPEAVHGRVLGFSISHDDQIVRIHAHYPEIDGEKTTFWRDTLKQFSIGDNKGRNRLTCYQFTLNVCQMFALPFVTRLTNLIDELPEPTAQPLESAISFDDVSVQSSQEDMSAPESQAGNFKKPRNNSGLNAELRHMIQNLQQQLERQRQDAERQRQDAERQRQDAERQRDEMKEREAQLMTQLEQQRHKSDEKLNELLEMLKAQRS